MPAEVRQFPSEKTMTATTLTFNHPRAMTAGSYPLVNEKNFAHATRDTGYRSTAAAVSELVDNSVQAGATRIRVVIRQSGVGKEREITLAVWDDGCGMDARVLQQALQFGGSTRFNDRSSLGRFGMGLPNSSASQARRVEVFTWRSPRRVLYSYLDLDEIARGDLRTVPQPVVAALPEWAPAPGCSGTLVVWTKCDRLDFRKAGTLERKLERELGRIFRYLLWDGVSITINDTPVVPIDPLFCHPRAQLNGAEPYLDPLIYELRLQDGSPRTAPVVVRFARLPVTRWHALPVDEKRRVGIVGGAGVSVVRAGREIAHGWYFMGNKRRQNYDDWWRCEVSFDPVLDEWFGVTHSKQSIRPTQELNGILAPDLELVAHQLSAEVRLAFATVNRRCEDPARKRATDREWRLPRVPVAPTNANGAQRIMSHLTYKIVDGDLATRSFFEWELCGRELVMTLNRNHAFFRQVYERARDHGAEWVRCDLECILLAFARAVEMTGQGRADKLREAWSDVLATYVGD